VLYGLLKPGFSSILATLRSEGNIQTSLVCLILNTQNYSREEKRGMHASTPDRRIYLKLQRVQHLCCGARLAALTFPLAPFRSPRGAEGGYGVAG